MAEPQNTLISCKDLSFSYENTLAVEGLNFHINSGDYLCIIGENGSGKSTLIKGLLKLKKPLSGTIEYSPFLKATEIGYLPQQTAAQKDFPASVFEVVLSGRLSNLGLFPFYSKSDKKMALDNLEKLNILNLKNKCYRELSGGQQQRVLLCRALCAANKVILLDEPVAGLDPLITKDMYELIKKINTETDMTIIMVSHDINSALEYASHILHLKNTQVFFGTKEDYLKSDIGSFFTGGRTYV